jgi:molybdate transport system regulatory protein
VSKCGTARVRVSVFFDSGARIGPGKAKLLESIRDTGSISAAAREMVMSYKRAWVLLDSINQAFTAPVVTAAPGRAGGGGAILTPFGVEAPARYNRILDRAATDARSIIWPRCHVARAWRPAQKSENFRYGQFTIAVMPPCRCGTGKLG